MMDFIAVLWVLFTKYVNFLDYLIANLVYQLIVDSVDVLNLNMKW